MYRRFLNDEDYLGIITKDALFQLTRGNSDRFIQAEQSAEMSLIEYLSENYEIETELNKGKFIAEYDRCITYPIGVHIYYEGKTHEIIRSISGYKAPATIEYWEEFMETNIDSVEKDCYSQFKTYYNNDIVSYNGTLYKCINENGYKFADIRIPMVYAWLERECDDWQPVVYSVWDVVKYDNGYYTLISLNDFDNNINPLDSNCWGAIADYDPGYNEYELSVHEYVVYKDKVFYPETDVNADIPVIGKNLTLHDNRNYNLKKHMVRLAIYELTKLIAPNNVSTIRVKDYEESLKWLYDASKLKLNPQIPRKLEKDKKPVTDWQMATFQTDYDPYKNPWLV